MTTEGTVKVDPNQTTSLNQHPTQQSSGFVNMNMNEIATQIQNTTVNTINENHSKEGDDQFNNSKIIFKI